MNSEDIETAEDVVEFFKHKPRLYEDFLSHDVKQLFLFLLARIEDLRDDVGGLRDSIIGSNVMLTSEIERVAKNLDRFQDEVNGYDP
jgi:hypothetical protein